MSEVPLYNRRMGRTLTVTTCEASSTTAAAKSGIRLTAKREKNNDTGFREILYQSGIIEPCSSMAAAKFGIRLRTKSEQKNDTGFREIR